MKRILSMLLCLALVIGFIPVFTMPAQAAEGTWTLVTKVSDLAVGDQIIIAAVNAAVALSTTQNTNNRGQTSITKSADKKTLTAAPSSSVQILTLKEGKTSGTYAFYTGTSGYLYAAGGTSTKNNYMKTKTALDNTGSFSISIASSGVATVKCADSTVVKNTLRHNSSSSLFSCYSSGQNDICFYKFVAKACTHENCTYEQTSATQHTPKCECGWVGDPVNHEFGEYTPVEGGHNRVCDICDYAEATVPCVNNGTGKCGTCGVDMGCPHEWEDAYNETQHYQVCSLCGGTKGEEDHELAKTYTDTTHTSACDCGYSVTEKHVLTNEACSDCNFKLKSEMTGGWVKVTDASTLKAGDRVVIVAKDYNYALSTNQKDNNRGQDAVTKSGNTVTLGNDVQIMTLETGTVTGTFAFNVGTKGYLCAASSGSNYLRSSTTRNGESSWKITIDANGTATIVSQGSYTRNTMQYNQSSSLFACYASASQKAICIYKYVANDTEVNVFQADTRLKDTLNLAFHFTADTEDAIVKAGALIRIGDETYNYIATAGTGYYSVEVSGIYAQSIDTVVYIKPYVELAGGLVYGTEKSTSVLKCLEYMYNNEDESKETKLVIKDLLNYANAARNYFVAKGTMSAPAQAFNNVLAEADRVLAWDEGFRAGLAEVEETTGAFVPENGTVIAGIQEALRLRVEFADTNVAGFVYWNADEYAANSGNHTVATGTQTFVMDGGVAKGYIENIYAYEMYVNFYIRAYNAEGELSKTYTRSIAAYITIEMDDNADDEAYVELCKAMLIYGNTAKESDAIVKG